MKIDTYKIAKMDCPSEEQMIRMKLSGITTIKNLEFDLANRKLTVLHSGESEEIYTRLESLDLDTVQIESAASDKEILESHGDDEHHQKKLLITVLAINFFFFIFETVAGFLSNSMGLVADGLDMLADAIVYGMALAAVGSHLSRKQRVASISGYLQLILALLGFFEVVRRFIYPEETPEYLRMIVVSSLALLGNGASLIILNRSKNDEAHIRASKIFTSNDVLANIGVIIAGVLVHLTDTQFPDLVIGAVVFYLVLRGAIRILKLR